MQSKRSTVQIILQTVHCYRI